MDDQGVNSDRTSAVSALTILIVCEGNICRSPAAERLLQAGLGATVWVSSAGTNALVGGAIAEPMAALLRASGVEDGHFIARQLSEHHLRSASLVLGMTRQHRAAIVEVWPASVRRAFTLREFARLLQHVDVSQLPAGSLSARLAAAVPLAAGQRYRSDGSPKVDDITDPYRRTAADYRTAYVRIQEAVSSITSFASAKP